MAPHEPRTLLNHEGLVLGDPWITLRDDEAAPDDEADIIVDLARYLEHSEALIARSGRLGIKLDGTDALEPVLSALERFDLLALDFPKFTDGRSYSLARLLRRHGFEGELRATGDVLRDQLFFMKRVGFDTFELAPGLDPESGLEAFDEFSKTYQPAADTQHPVWARYDLNRRS